MAQNSVFSQVIKHIPRSRFQFWVDKYQGNKGVRTLDCWTWFGSLLFSQLTGHDSIRALERVFCMGSKVAQKLRFTSVRRSTLADANRTRPLEILESVFGHVLEKAQRVIGSQHGFHFKGSVFALDASVIRLCLNLCPWATFHHGKGAFKLHTAIDLAGDLPQMCVITPARVHEIRVARSLKLEKAATYIFDKGYTDYGWFNEINRAGTYFVTRAKDNLQFKVLESQKTNRTQGHICDQIISLKKTLRGSLYEGKLRRIKYREPDTNKVYVFLTNRFDLPTETICDLYKARWRVENFFKTMKQYLKIKKFLGTSVNSIKAQVLVALIAYLLIQIIKKSFRTHLSTPDLMAVIGTLILHKQQLAYLLGDLPCTTRYPPPLQLPLGI